MATRTIANAGGNFNVTGSWVEGIVPTNADDIVGTATSGTITLNVAGVCQSLDISAGGTIAGSGFGLSIGGANVQASNIALKLRTSGTPFSFSATTNVSFISTKAASSVTADFGGLTIANMNVTVNQSSGITLQLITHGFTTTGTVTHTQGTFDTNGQACTWGTFTSSGALTRVLTLGSSNITIIPNGWTLIATGLTFNANTSTINVSGNVVFAGGGFNYNTVNLSSGATTTVTGVNTFVNLNRTGSQAKLDNLTLSANQTVTGTLTLAGNGTQSVNRLMVQSNTIGTQRTINCTGAAVVINGDVDFQDIDITGSPSWTNAGSAYIGDALGNGSLITTNRTTPANQTATGTASFTWSTHGWTSRVPLPQDNVVINNAFAAGQTITANMPRLGASIDCSSATGSPAFTYSGTQVISFGNIALASGMLASGNTFNWSLQARGSQTVTTNGATFDAGFRWAFSGPGATWNQQDDILMLNTAATIDSSINISVGNSGGAYNTNNHNITTADFIIASGNFTGGTSTITTNDKRTNASITTFNVSATATVSAASVNVVVNSDQGSNLTTVDGGGKTWGSLTINSGISRVQLFSNNTWTTLSLAAQRNYIFLASSTTTVTNFNATGVNNGYLYLPNASGHYISAPDSAALSITGDLTIDCLVALDDWTPTTAMVFVGKMGAAGNRSFNFFVSTDGSLRSSVSNDGTNVLATQTSTAVNTIPDGSQKWVRWSFKADNGSAQRVSRYYTSDDRITWTQLGSTVTTATAATISDNASILEIGSDTNGTANQVKGKMYRAVMYNSDLGTSSGTPVFDADFSTKAFGANSFTESSANAATVTINGTLAQAGDGRIALTSTVGGTAATLTYAGSGIVSSDYLVIQDIKATPASLTVTSFTKQTLIPLSATLSFVGAIGRKTLAVLTGTLSFIGNNVRFVTRPMTATLSFVGSFASGHTFTKALTGTLSFAGSIAKTTKKATSGTLSFVGKIVAGGPVGKVLTGTLSFIGRTTKASTRSLSGGLSFVGTVTKSTRRSLTATLSFVGALLTGSLFKRTLTATLTFTGTFSKSISKNLTGTASFIGTVKKSVQKSFVAGLTFSGDFTTTLKKAFLKILNFIFNQTLPLQFYLNVPGNLQFTLTVPGAIQITFNKPATLALSLTVPSSVQASMQTASPINITLNVPGPINLSVSAG